MREQHAGVAATAPPAEGRPLRVDAHCHIWDLSVRDVPQLARLPDIDRSWAFDDFAPSLAREGFDGAIVVQALASVPESRDLLAAAAGDPAIRGVCGWIDIHAPDAERAIRTLREAPGGSRLCALRYALQGDDGAWADAALLGAARAIGDAGLAFELLIRADQLTAAARLVGAAPETRFILDHGAKPGPESLSGSAWEHALHALAALPNVAAKLSGALLRGDGDAYARSPARRQAEIVLSAFGPERTMFGGEWPVCLTTGGYHDVVRNLGIVLAGLGAPARDAVLGTTACRWFGLRDAHSEVTDPGT